MTLALPSAPLLVSHYTDPVEGTRGCLVIDRLVNGLAAGGLRLLPGADEEMVQQLARAMSCKLAVAGLRVGGAKAALDLDPRAPCRADVLRRFLQTLRPLIEAYWSVGPDMNTTMAELEGFASSVGIASLKIAIAHNRSMTEQEFLRRYALFEERVDGATVNELRAGVGVSAATSVLLESLAEGRVGRVAIQGAGTMGGAVARLLAKSGVRIVAWADDQKCLYNEEGLDVLDLLARRDHGRLPDVPSMRRRSSSVFEAPSDVLVLAATSRAFGTETVQELGCKGIVEAANLALEPSVEEAAHGAGVIVVPDWIASVGGSVAVEALYETNPQSPAEILQHVEARIRALTRRLLAEGKVCTASPRQIVSGWLS